MAAPARQFFEHPVTITVKGTIFDDLGDPVRDAAVNVLVGEQPVGKTESGTDGAFSMIDLSLSEGIHKVRAYKQGYATSEETFVVTQQMANSSWLITLRLNPIGWDDASSDPNQVSLPPRRDERRKHQQKYVTVEVFFATDRKFNPVRNIYKRFGSERSIQDGLSFGSCHVSIPEGHRIGQLESPFMGLSLLENPNRHVVLLDLDRLEETVFFQELSSRMSASPNHDAFVFVHGYNVSFPEAIRRTAQIAFELKFQGAPICYSWPSSGEYSKYMADEAAIEWTIPHLGMFLKKMRTATSARTLHLIAHSMGNRALTRALSEVGSAKPSPSDCDVRQIIMAAPDIDAGVFTQRISEIVQAGERTSLYMSSNDLPLAISQQFHAYPRAGQGGNAMVIVSGVDSIDASLVPTGFTGHSYYAGTRTVLTDIYELVRYGTPPPRFGLREAKKGDKVYWQLLP